MSADVGWDCWDCGFVIADGGMVCWVSEGRWWDGVLGLCVCKWEWCLTLV